jgi:isoleucyl-tRNA synthetase
VRLSDLILTRLTEAYRKLRNTFRYALGNLHDFDPVADAVPSGELLEIDRWILHRAATLVENCRAWYDELSYHRVYQAIYNFATSDLSAVYFDVLKDRLYTSAAKSRARRSAQTALWRVNETLVRLAAPILAYTAEEAWGHVRHKPGAPDSVHLALMPDPAELLAGLPAVEELSANWDRLLAVRDVALKSLEAARNEKLIGAPLEAKVVITAPADLYELLQRYSAELPSIFITSEAEVRPGAELAASVERASGVKCERCWKYTRDVGSDSGLPTVCAPCASAVREMTR